MHSELVPLPKIEQLLERARASSDEDILKGIVAGHAQQAHGLILAAVNIRAAEERNLDISEVRERCTDFVELARKFAYGNIVQELSVFWPDNERLIKLLARLPRPDQLRAANDEAFPVIEMDKDGAFVKFLRTAARMTYAQQKRVFGAGFIRTEQQQQDVLTDQRTREMRKKPPEKIGPLVLDYELGGFHLQKGHREEFIPLALAEEAVRALRRFGRKR
jgi:hypothetical protein